MPNSIELLPCGWPIFVFTSKLNILRNKGETLPHLIQFSHFFPTIFLSDCPQNAQVHLGCVELQPAPDPVQLNREMIALTLKCNVDLKSDNGQLLEENRRLKQQHQTILQE